LIANRLEEWLGTIEYMSRKDTRMTPLREALHTRNEQILKYVESLVDKATPQLWHTLSTFPSGTKHTPEHTQTVEHIASLLISDGITAKLNDDEIAMLILACHYHDLGMAGSEADNATSEGRDRVRQEHAISIGTRILERWQELGFENENYAEILAEICRGHRPAKVNGEANWDILPRHRNIGPNRYVRLRLVSAMIYAADELHLGDDRAPKREEDWKGIEDSESLRHWRRHQAICGPTKIGDAITFDVRINTVSFEKDLRKVLKKALMAVADLKRELEVEGFREGHPQIELQWIRDALWKLLITRVCSDDAPRQRNQITERSICEFNKCRSQMEDLSTLCRELPDSADEMMVQIGKAISSFETRSFLVSSVDPATLQLDSSSRSFQALLQLAQNADKTERLFACPVIDLHEQFLYESEAGKRYIRQVVFPEIKASFAVDVAKLPENDSLRETIESSPTSCRLLQHVSTPPGPLVKRDLLQVAVAAGVCFDLMNNPDLVLEKSLRSAIRKTFELVTERLPRFLSLIQELAIVKGLSFEQVVSILNPSESLRSEIGNVNSESASINISQQVPRERLNWSLPYLLLAGQRAQEEIQILNIPDAPIRVSIDSSMQAISQLPQEQPVMIGITPSRGFVSSVISVRAAFTYDPLQRILIFQCELLGPIIPQDAPIIISLPSREPMQELRVDLSFMLLSLTVGQLLDLRHAYDSSIGTELEIRLELNRFGKIGSVSERIPRPLPVFEELTTESLVVLAELDRQLPVPFVADRKLLEKLIGATFDTKPQEFEFVKTQLATHKPSVTSVLLRFASVSGKDFREEFLGYLPIGHHFGTPQVSPSKLSQEEFDKLWESGEGEFKLVTSFREDCHELAVELRGWMDDPGRPFPFKCNNELHFHYCKTRVEQIHLRHVDRFWCIERPVVFRLCPVTKAEQYRIEMEYWKSVGDIQRVELLQELIAQAEEAESSASEVKVAFSENDLSATAVDDTSPTQSQQSDKSPSAT